MDRELLIEIGVEELPASWLPGLTTQIAARLDARLKELRLPPAAAIESYSTPRRLTVCVGKLAERQTDFEEVLMGPPVSASFDARRPTDAGRHRVRAQEQRRSVSARAAGDAERHLPRLSQAAARQGRGRCAARRA